MINPAKPFYALGRLVFPNCARPAGPLQPIGVDAQLRSRRVGARWKLFL
jgi:hypothetical protein